MRELKFRTWYLREKRMIDWEEMKDGTETIDIYLEKRCGDISEPMQFTGLTDKNKKEAYDGDIWENRHGLFWEVSWSDEHVCWALNRISKNTAENPYNATKLYSIGFLSEGEIVGNKHENPELLNN